VRRVLTVGEVRGPKPEILNVAEFIEGPLPMWRDLLGDSIELHFASQVGDGQVLADPTGLEQILLNLVLNASDAMKGVGELRIDLSSLLISEPTRPADGLDAGVYQRIAVSDTGEGIPPENLDRIFLPFFTTKAESGTGLGLYTSREVARNSGGALTVASDATGTTFELLLPAVDAATPAHAIELDEAPRQANRLT